LISMKNITNIKLLLIVTIILCFTVMSFADRTRIRNAAVAGQFYPQDPAELKSLIDSYLKDITEVDLGGKLIAGIVPHAGYVYSGHVAAHFYKQLGKSSPKTIVLVGPSHRSGFRGISVYPEGLYKTPLGDVSINTKLASSILALGDPYTFHEAAHKSEHSIEVQIPFLQRVLDDFTIVPILVGNGYNLETILAETLHKIIKSEHTIVLASSDMTHYPEYSAAREIDLKACEIIKNMDTDALRKFDKNTMESRIHNLKCTFCGLRPVLTIMEFCKLRKSESARILKYANSGDVRFGKKDQVVGYCSVAFINSFKKDEEFEKGEQKTSRGHQKISSDVANELLLLSRTTLETFIKHGKILKPVKKNGLFIEERGVFVTLNKRGSLRGCIGHIYPMESLEKSVISNTVNAAVKDPRFPRVTELELAEISIEISVLTIPRKIANISEFVVGKHGIILVKGTNRAVFLPQVAPEQGWDRAGTLNNLSRKAGLPFNAWKEDGAEYFIFEAEVFHEGEK